MEETTWLRRMEDLQARIETVITDICSIPSRGGDIEAAKAVVERNRPRWTEELAALAAHPAARKYPARIQTIEGLLDLESGRITNAFSFIEL